MEHAQINNGKADAQTSKCDDVNKPQRPIADHNRQNECETYDEHWQQYRENPFFQLSKPLIIIKKFIQHDVLHPTLL